LAAVLHLPPSCLVLELAQPHCQLQTSHRLAEAHQWTMTPEAANGRGSVPIVDKTPFSKEPVGPNDIYGVPNF